MKNTEKILAYGLVGYGLYYIYENVIKKAPTGGGNTQVDVKPTATYEEKVIALQKALNVGADGKAGKITNGELENLYTSPPKRIGYDISLSTNYPNLRANGRGVISPSNIDYYINALNSNTYPNAVYKQGQATSQDANSIERAYNQGGILRTKNAVVYQGVTKDTARNVYVSTGKSYGYNANASFITPESTSRLFVGIVDKTATGKLVVRVRTLSSTYFLLVSPDSVIVS
jgi:hypothetical protein